MKTQHDDKEQELWDALGGGPAPSDLQEKKAPKRTRVRKALETARDLKPQGPTPFQAAHPSVVAWLESYKGNFSFYVSLKEQYEQRGSLSERQVESIYRAIERDGGESLKPVPVEVAKAFDAWFKVFIGESTYKEISHPAVDAFRAAIYPVKPKQVFTIAPNERIRVSTGAAKRMGSEAGLTRAHFVFEVVEVFAETAKAYHVTLKAVSQRSGVCCICGKTLTNPESVSKGIGPECGDGYSLDWKSDRDVLLQLADKLKVVASDIKVWLPKSQIKERLNEKEDKASQKA